MLGYKARGGHVVCNSHLQEYATGPVRLGVGTLLPTGH